MNNEERLLVVGLGETLFDCYDDRRVLGGAPLNFAVHADRLLRGVRGSAFPISRVGDDQLGREATNTLRERGVRTEHIQIDPSRPTGRVQVTLDSEGVAEYEFETGSAWDHLELTDAASSLAKECHAVCFGTLAQRSAISRQSINAFLDLAKDAVRVFDVNLREDYYSLELIAASLQRATVAKANQEELEILADWFLPADERSGDHAHDAGRLREQFGLEWLAVTRGPLGVALATADGWFAPSTSGSEYEPAEDADTVGAGDACCAALVTGHLLRWDRRQTVELANRVGAFVASRPGATPPLTDTLVAAVTR